MPYKILNVLGQVLAQGELQGRSLQLNLSHLNKGLYFIEINNHETLKIQLK